jgi:hypothetical protein
LSFWRIWSFITLGQRLLRLRLLEKHGKQDSSHEMIQDDYLNLEKQL